MKALLILIMALGLGGKQLIANTLEPTNEENLVVVVNINSEIDSLSRNEVIDIYMGRYLTFPNGGPVRVLDYAPRSEYKKQFYRMLVNKDEAMINAYWARLLFSGRASPPENIGTVENMMQLLSSSIDTLGYIPLENIDENVKIVFGFDELQP